MKWTRREILKALGVGGMWALLPSGCGNSSHAERAGPSETQRAISELVNLQREVWAAGVEGDFEQARARYESLRDTARHRADLAGHTVATGAGLWLAARLARRRGLEPCKELLESAAEHARATPAARPASGASHHRGRLNNLANLFRGAALIGHDQLAGALITEHDALIEDDELERATAAYAPLTIRARVIGLEALDRDKDSLAVLKQAASGLHRTLALTERAVLHTAREGSIKAREALEADARSVAERCTALTLFNDRCHGIACGLARVGRRLEALAVLERAEPLFARLPQKTAGEASYKAQAFNRLARAYDWCQAKDEAAAARGEATALGG